MFFNVMIFIACVYVYSSVTVYLYSIWKKRDFDYRPLFGKKIFSTRFFFVGCLVGVYAFLHAGFERALFFMPEKWGGIDEEGDWWSYKFTISSTLSLLACIRLFSKYDDLLKWKDSN